MGYNFPDAPTPGAIFAPPGGPSWSYTNGAWVQTAASVIPPAIHGAQVFDSMAQAMASAIPSTLNSVFLAGYYTPGDFGGAMYKKVSSEPAHNGKFQSADGAWWENAEIILTPQMFGAKADGVTDCYQAIMDAIESRFVNDGWYYATGPEIFFPNGKYIVSQTIELKRQCHFRGSGHGMAYSSGGPALYFPINTIGIIVQSYNTIGDGSEVPPTFAGNPCIIEGIELWSVRNGSDKTRHGIWMRGMCVIRNVYIDGFSGDGIHIVAAAGAIGILAGNCNLFRLEYLRIQSCGGSGIFCQSADANAGTGLAIDCSSNGRWGIWDNSFLGNTWIGCHTAGNGDPYCGDNGPTGSATVTHAGANWCAARGATEAQLVATTPGTDAAVWTFNPHPGMTPWLPGQPVGTYFYGGAYCMEGLNSATVVLGCYAEGGQGGNVAFGVNMFLGGMHACGWREGGGVGGRHGSRLRTAGGNEVGFETIGPTMNATLGGLDNAGVVLRWGHTTDDDWHFRRSGADWRIDRGYSDAAVPLVITGANTVYDFGTGVPQPYKAVFPEIVIGTRKHSASSIPPGTGAHAMGEIWWNTNPAAGGKAGYICVTAGTPGVWKAFGAIDP